MNRSSIIFVLTKPNKDPISFLFGQSDTTCFQSEEPGILYSLNRVKGVVNFKSRRVNKVSSPPIKDGKLLLTVKDKKEVFITYEIYSYFIFKVEII